MSPRIWAALCVVAVCGCSRNPSEQPPSSRPDARAKRLTPRPLLDPLTGVTAPNAQVRSRCVALVLRATKAPDARRCEKDADCVCLHTWMPCGRMVSRRHAARVATLRQQFTKLGCGWSRGVECTVSNCGAPSCVKGQCQDRAPRPRRHSGAPSRLHVWVPKLASRAAAAPAVRRRLQELGPTLNACFVPALKRTPTLTGKVEIRMVVKEDGTLAHVASHSGLHASFTDCVNKLVSAWHLPAPGQRLFAWMRLSLGPSR